jgi:hypothetical protein
MGWNVSIEILQGTWEADASDTNTAKVADK